MAYTEFYCQSGGSNLNAGSDNNNAALYTSTNGNWSTVTNVFTPTDGTNPVAAGVAVGQFASIYVDGSTITTYIARITAVTNAVNGPITVSTTIKEGNAPTTSATARTIKVGGAWKGPNAAVGWPINTFVGTAKNVAGNPIRINFKNDATYSITTGISGAAASGVTFQGYTTTPGDGGKAIIDGGTTAIILLTTAGSGNTWKNLIFAHNGTTGINDGVQSASSATLWLGCVFHDLRGAGLTIQGVGATVKQCEAYACNLSNNTAKGGFKATTSATFIRCVSHDNTGSNADGFFANLSSTIATYINCIAETNGGVGFNLQLNSAAFMVSQCDSSNNTSDGLLLVGTVGNNGQLTVENSNFLKNGGWGINTNITGSVMVVGTLSKNGFGTGTQANSSGNITSALSAIIDDGTSISYPTNLTPWLDAPNGKFDIVLGTAIGTGIGTFTTTAPSYGPTTGYPDIGAAIHSDVVLPPRFIGDWISPYGYVGALYLSQWSFSGPITISIIGSLPPGLSLVNTSGNIWQIVGTPTTVGTYTFTFRGTNNGNIIDDAFTIQIFPGLQIGGGGEGGGEGEPLVVELPRPTIKVRDPELADIIRRARRAEQTINNLDIVGASGSATDGFMLDE